MVSLARQTDRTLFFDFLPIDLGQSRGSPPVPAVHVPGQVYYNARAALVLQGADGVVSWATVSAQLDENLESLQTLQSNLLDTAWTSAPFPGAAINKQDLPRELILSPADLDDALNFRSVPSFSAGRAPWQGCVRDAQGSRRLVLKTARGGTAA